jgi:hypothetical protein
MRTVVISGIKWMGIYAMDWVDYDGRQKGSCLYLR